MSRPDPRLVSRMPPARAEAHRPGFARSGARADADRQPLRLWDADGRLDHDAVCRLIDAAEIIVEGRIYESGVRVGAAGHGPHAVFLGTALLTIDLSRLPIAIRRSTRPSSNGCETPWPGTDAPCSHCAIAPGARPRVFSGPRRLRAWR
jgi:hypothetical protein